MSLAVSPPREDPVILAHRRAAGVSLLQAFVHLLTEGTAKGSFTRRKVNELYREIDGMRIRHGYAGGEFRLQVTRPSGARFTVKYDIRRPMPSLGQLIRATVDGPPPGWAPDANNEMVIRGDQANG